MQWKVLRKRDKLMGAAHIARTVCMSVCLSLSVCLSVCLHDYLLLIFTSVVGVYRLNDWLRPIHSPAL